MQRRDKSGRFAKGSVPHNKGKYGQGGHLPTCFKKGNMPHNYRPVGSTRIDTGGYVYIKIAEPKKWRLLHRLIWEREYGAIPEGCAVIFGDGNKQNFALENLLLVTRAELVMLNKLKLMGKTAEITKTGILTANLVMRLRSRAVNIKKAHSGQT